MLVQLDEVNDKPRTPKAPPSTQALSQLNNTIYARHYFWFCYIILYNIYTAVIDLRGLHQQQGHTGRHQCLGVGGRQEGPRERFVAVWRRVDSRTGAVVVPPSTATPTVGAKAPGTVVRRLVIVFIIR